MRCLSLLFVLLVGTAQADEPSTKDAFGDPLPNGAAARLGTVRLRSGEYVRGAALAPDGKTVAVNSARGFVQFLDAVSGAEVRQFRTDSASGAAGVVFAPDGKSLATSDYSSLQVWDAASGQLKGRFKPQQRSFQLESLSFSGDGTLLAAAPDGPTAQGKKNQVTVWDVVNNKELGPFEVLQDYRAGAALSADGKRLATWGQHLNRLGGNDRTPGQTIQLWDVKETKELRRLVFDGGNTVQQAAFSPDGATLAAVAGAATVVVWDVESGKEIRRLAGRRGLAFVRFSPDGKKLLAGDSQGAILMWDTTRGTRLGVCEGPTRAQSLAFMADGGVRACGVSGQAILVWEVPSGRLLTPAAGHTARVLSMGFSGDGKSIVSAGQDGKIIIWDRATGKEVKQLTIRDDEAARFGAAGRFEFVSIAPDARYLVMGSRLGSGARLCELPSGRVVCDFDSSGSQPDRASIAFAPNSSLLALPDRSGQMRIWDVESGQEKAQVKVALGRFASFGGNLTFSPDSALLAWCHSYYDNATRNQVTDLWLIDSGTGKELHQLKLPGWGGGLQGLAFSSDGRTVAHGQNNSIALWDVARGTKRRELAVAPGATITCLSTSPDGRMLACACICNQGDTPTHEVHLYETASGGVRRRFVGHRGVIGELTWSPDGSVLASASYDTTILLWGVAGKVAAAPQPLAAAELDKLWSDLAENDAERGFRAMTLLQSVAAQTLALFKERLKVEPGKTYSDDELTKLVRDLESDKFTVRQQASGELEQAGRQALPVLQQALRVQPAPTLELRRRVEGLLEKLNRDDVPPETLRQLRSVEILERVGNADTRTLLQVLSSGAGHRPLTLEAKNALQRLSRR